MIIFITVLAFILLHIYNANKELQKGFDTNVKVNDIKSLTLLIPCYNEGKILKTSLDNIKKLNYKKLEVILINDGSTDNTLDVMKEELSLYKEKNIHFSNYDLEYNEIKSVYKSRKFNNIIVIDKDNGGKADSLNAGIELATSDYVITLDADSILHRNSLDEINKSLQDSDVIAVGGNVMALQNIKYIDNTGIYVKKAKTMLENLQFIEYLKGFNVFKVSLSRMNALAIISGAFGVFDREVMLKVKGFSHTVGEDICVTLKFNKYAYENNKKIIVNNRAICFTEVPNNYKDYIKQRIRWQWAFLDAIYNHRGLLIKNILKTPVSFFTIVESFILNYVSITVTLFSIIYTINEIIETNSISLSIMILFIVNVVVFVAYITTAINISKKLNVNFSNYNKLSFYCTMLYEFTIYRLFMIILTLWASIKYIFTKDKYVWNKVSRTGDEYELSKN